MKRTIIIMAKVPLAGTVKTRLQPALSPEKCAELARAFLRDTVNKAESVCENIILAYSPAAEINALQKILPSEKAFLEQEGADLGEKMLNAFRFAFARQTDSVAVMIGTDSPTFPAEFIEKAFEYLETGTEIVLGKTEDGGFYLIGLKKILPDLFDRIRWSTGSVFARLSRNLEKLKFGELKFVPTCFDVDTAPDLERLNKEMSENQSVQKIAPETHQWLISNSELF
jgi:rSAM/selenodomain-associated transferase 1